MKKKIVIVDDDNAIHEIYKIIFEREDLDTVILASPHPLLQNEYLDADIFLIDKEMPETDGLDVCRFLKGKESTRPIPVVIISACADLTGICLEAGAAQFIEKPFKVKDLIQRVKMSLASSQTPHAVTEVHCSVTHQL